MFEFTLLKSLFFELDPDEMEGVQETKRGSSTFRRIEVSYASVPEVTSLMAEERILPMVDRYFLYINDEKAEIGEPAVRQTIYEFYKEHFPGYLKKGLPDVLDQENILECFEVFNMPDYRPKHAFPGLITLEDLHSGKIREDKRLATFPGLDFLNGRTADSDQPAIAAYEGYTAFAEDEAQAREEAKTKIEAMKKRFAAELAGLKLAENDLPKEETAKEEVSKEEIPKEETQAKKRA